ncbi:MAG: transcriptional regulator [Afipia sp. 62-7]|nr:helix-turn-helix transcriptional regulator [Alphaproteobacteria bacterium]OJU14471.1 MAG: transcriptional regulator [Afipia sp. 62-7]
MKNDQAVEVLAALAQPTRMRAFQTLVNCEPAGVSAGDLARMLDVPQNTLSSHLSILSRAGLVTAERQSRSIIYRADLETFQAVALFLLQDCCRGRPEFCAPLIESLESCCVPAKEAVGSRR